MIDPQLKNALGDIPGDSVTVDPPLTMVAQLASHLTGTLVPFLSRDRCPILVVGPSAKLVIL
jgi:hypothetical protein